MGLVIYKLLLSDEWEKAQASPQFTGSTADRADGFIHFSTAEQAAETAVKHFPGAPDLVLAEIDPEALGRPLKWEPSRGGALFPHLYASMPLSAVRRTWVLALGSDGLHIFPQDIA